MTITYVHLSIPRLIVTNHSENIFDFCELHYKQTSNKQFRRESKCTHEPRVEVKR